MLNKDAQVTQGGIGSLLLIAPLWVGVFLTLARLPRRDGNLLTTVIRYGDAPRRDHSLKARERLARDRRQAQQALDDLGLSEDLVAEFAGRLRSQQLLLAKTCGMMIPSLFGGYTNAELCRVRGWDKNLLLVYTTWK